MADGPVGLAVGERGREVVVGVGERVGKFVTDGSGAEVTVDVADGDFVFVGFGVNVGKGTDVFEGSGVGVMLIVGRGLGIKEGTRVGTFVAVAKGVNMNVIVGVMDGSTVAETSGVKRPSRLGTNSLCPMKISGEGRQFADFMISASV